jgi:hypothetical protein
VEVYGADVRHDVRATGSEYLISATLLGLAAWYGRTAQARWLLARGADAAGAGGLIGSATFSWEPPPLDLVMMGRRSNSGTARCPAALLLALLEHGADGRVLLTVSRYQYRCDEHKNDCATPIIARALPESGPSSTRMWCAIHAAIDFVLDCVGRPVPALSVLLDGSTRLFPLEFHPVVKCVRVIIEKYNTIRWNDGLMDALEWLASRNHTDPVDQTAVQLAYQAITWSSINSDMRYQMLKLLLETTGVHPDVKERREEESALLIEVNRLADAGSWQDLRCLEVLLRYGADPLRRHSRLRIEGGDCSPLGVAKRRRAGTEVVKMLKSHIWVAKKGQLGS